MKYNKNKKSIYICLLFAFVMVICMPLTAFAQNTTLTANVPSQLQLKIEINGKGAVQVGEKRFSETTTISVDRHTETAIVITPVSNYEIKSVLYNGEAMTENLQNYTLVLPEPRCDSVLTVNFMEMATPPQTGDNPHLIFICSGATIFLGFMLMCLAIQKKETY